MADGQVSSPKPIRPWREVAEQLAQEHDSVRIVTLSEELMRSLDREEPLKRNIGPAIAPPQIQP